MVDYPCNTQDGGKVFTFFFSLASIFIQNGGWNRTSLVTLDMALFYVYGASGSVIRVLEFFIVETRQYLLYSSRVKARPIRTGCIVWKQRQCQLKVNASKQHIE